MNETRSLDHTWLAHGLGWVMRCIQWSPGLNASQGFANSSPNVFVKVRVNFQQMISSSTMFISGPVLAARSVQFCLHKPPPLLLPRCTIHARLNLSLSTIGEYTSQNADPPSRCVFTGACYKEQLNKSQSECGLFIQIVRPAGQPVVHVYILINLPTFACKSYNTDFIFH